MRQGDESANLFSVSCPVPTVSGGEKRSGLLSMRPYRHLSSRGPRSERPSYGVGIYWTLGRRWEGWG
jgi:hypothetical protein